MKLYDKVKNILTLHPETRDSDKKLTWKIWEIQGVADFEGINYLSFLKATSGDSITRAARMIKQKHPELRGTLKVLAVKQKKQEEKGTFVFREQINFL